MRQSVQRLVDSALFRNTILGIIVFNAVLLGLETSPAVMNRAGTLILALDMACLTIFVVEIALKLFARRLGFSAMAGTCSTL